MSKAESSENEGTGESSSSSSSSSSSASSEDGSEQGYVCYLLRSSPSHPGQGRTYTGITKDLNQRLRKHNGELVGGAKATRTGRPWLLVCFVAGFPSHGDALRFEWRLKRQRATQSRKLIPVRGGMAKRCANVYQVLNLERWTKSCRPAQEMPLLLTWYGGAPHALGCQPFSLPTYVQQDFVAANFTTTSPTANEGKEGELSSASEPGNVQRAAERVAKRPAADSRELRPVCKRPAGANVQGVPARQQWKSGLLQRSDETSAPCDID